MSGKAKFEAVEKQELISLENLIQMICKIAEYYEENGRGYYEISEACKPMRLI